MKQKTVRFGLVSTIIIFMIVSNTTVQNLSAKPTDFTVKNGESYTYIIDRYVSETGTNAEVASDKFTNVELLVGVGAEYKITVVNDTLRTEAGLYGGYFIEILFDNGTHTVLADNNLKPTFHYFSFIDWDFWIANMTANPSAYYNGDTINKLNIINGLSEVRFNITMAIDFGANIAEFVQTIRYNKTSGIANLVTLDTIDWASVGLVDTSTTMRLKGYDINTPIEPITTTTITVTSTASNTTTSEPITTTITTTTSDTNTGTVTTTTTTSTTVTSSTSSTTSSSTDTATTTTFTTSDTTTIVSDTMTSDTMATDTSSDTNTMMTTDDGVTDTVGSDTVSSSSRQLTSESKESTLERTNSTSETTESPTATLPVPAFGPIMTFTALMVTITIIRKKN